MDKLRQYLNAHLSLLFFSIFIPLFSIASVIFMIKLATYTAVIKLTVAEMGKLYLFVLPELFFYTLPIAFVVAATLSLYRLSNDNEMVVIFSLGISPLYILRILALPALFLSTLLMVNYLIITPYIKSINKNFLNAKTKEANFNLGASEFGHHFGDWMIFINSTDQTNKAYGDVVMFNKEMDDEIILAADKVQLVNNKGALQLQLIEGTGYSYDDQTFKHMKYDMLKINDKIDHDVIHYQNALHYWTDEDAQDKKHKLLVTNTLLSFFPTFSLFLIIALGIVHARHQKRWIYLWLFVSIVSYYALSIVLQQWLSFWTIPVVALGWLAVTYYLYRRLVGERF